MMPINKRLYLVILSFALPLLVLISAFWAHPSLDDYLWPIWQRKYSFFEFQVNSYTHLNGRVFATLLSYLTMPGTYFYSIYKFSLFLYVVALLGTLRFFLGTLVDFKNKIDALLFSNFLFFTIAALLLEFSTFFFWLTGTIVYASTLILFILLLGLVIKSYSKPQFKGIILITFLIPLFSEVGFFMMLPILLYFIIYKVILGKKREFFWILPFGVACLSLLINLFGSLHRLDLLRQANPKPMTERLIDIPINLFSSLIDLVLSPESLFFALTNLIILYAFIKYKDRLRSELVSLKPNHAFVLAISVFFLSFLASCGILGFKTPKRTLNLIVGGGEMMIIIYLAQIARVYGDSWWCNKLNTIPKWILGLALVLLLLLPSGLRQYFGDLAKLRAYRYDLFMKARYAAVVNSKDDTVYVVQLDPKTKPIALVFDTDLELDTGGARYYYNNFFAEYYHKKAVFGRRP